jgi:hypothetical protein
MGTEQPHFPFSGKPGLNVHLEYPSNPQGYFELFITFEISKLISRETNWYPQQLFENVSDIKLKSRVSHWNDMNRD